MSVWRRQIRLTIDPPNSAIVSQIQLNKRAVDEKIGKMRNKPYPPSLSRIPASTMDPDTGASTWALGSHRCTINIGSFTKKAIILQRYHTLFVVDISDNFSTRSIIREPLLLYKFIIDTRSGIDANNV